VVVSDVGGQLDLVTHDGNGLLFAPERVDQLACHLRRYVTDPSVRARQGQLGRRLAGRRSWARQVDLLLAHHDRVRSHRPEQLPPRLAASLLLHEGR
jgi:phosphatidylinositol alpha 1,6-mannosyltransferase